MTPTYQIRADYDESSIVVYQAYAPAIAEAALAAGRFVAPFSFTRMTWIKPSFLWMMHRSAWGRSAGQERILAIRITRAGWEEALSLAVWSSYQPHVYESREAWQDALAQSPVRLQWDPERTLRDGVLPYRSLQIGLGAGIVPRYVHDWRVSLTDMTPLVNTMDAAVQAGRFAEAEALLPHERVYPVPPSIAPRLGILPDSP